MTQIINSFNKTKYNVNKIYIALNIRTVAIINFQGIFLSYIAKNY